MPTFVNRHNKGETQFDNLHLTKIARVLTILTGDQMGLKHNLAKCAQEFSRKSHFKFGRNDAIAKTYIQRYTLPVTSYRQHKFNDGEQIFTYSPEIAGPHGYLKFKMKNESMDMMLSSQLSDDSGVNFDHAMFPELIKAVNILFEVGAIR